MFFLTLKGHKILRLLNQVAEKKGMPVERLARLALLKGLRSLTNNEVKLTVMELSDATLAQLSPTKRRLRRIDALIQKHWETRSDLEISRMIQPPTSLATIHQHRRAMGFKRRGATSPRQQRLDALIREHWQTKNDAEIGLMMNPALSRHTVYIRRLELGLKLKRGERAAKVGGEGVRAAIDPQEFERMVLHEGFTMTEYLRYKKLTCSKERLRQVAEQLGLKHSPYDRVPEWKLVRLARRLGNLNLANRDWLIEKIAGATSVSAVAAELELAESDLYQFIRGFKLTHPTLRRHGAQTVNLVCAKCGTKFVRLKRWVDRRRKIANGHAHELEFYCSVSCAGKYDRLALRKRREADMSPETQRLRKLRLEKIEREAIFIRENWQTMSDAELAERLGCSRISVENKRRGLGFKRM